MQYIFTVFNYTNQQMRVQYVKYYKVFVCVYKLSYMFQRVFAIFSETMTQRNLYTHEAKTS